MANFACPNCGAPLNGENACPACGTPIVYPDTNRNNDNSAQQQYDYAPIDSYASGNYNAGTPEYGASQQQHAPGQQQYDSNSYDAKTQIFQSSNEYVSDAGGYGYQDNSTYEQYPQPNAYEPYPPTPNYDQQSEKSNSRTSLWILVIAASVAVLIVSGWLIYDSFEKKQAREEKARIEAEQRRQAAIAEEQRIAEEKAAEAEAERVRQEDAARKSEFNANVVVPSVFITSSGVKSSGSVVAWLTSHNYKITTNNKFSTRNSDYGGYCSYYYSTYKLTLTNSEGKQTNSVSVTVYDIVDGYSEDVCPPIFEINFGTSTMAKKFYNEAAGYTGGTKSGNTFWFGGYGVDSSYGMTLSGSKITIESDYSC